MFRKSSTLLLVMILSLALTVPALAAPLSAETTVPGGNVSGTWDAVGSPYLIEGDITVPAGQTLTIDPGVEVSFQSWHSLVVNGTLIADGTASEPILFTATTSAGWLGIRFMDAPDGSLLDFVIVEKGRASGASPYDSGGGIYIQNSNPTISNSTIRDNFAKYSGGGIYLNNSNASLTANTIINNTAGQGGTSNGGGLAVWYSNPVLTDNIISGNSVSISGSYTTPSGYGGGLFLRSSDAILTGNLISDNHVNAALNSNARGGGLYLYYGSPVFVNNTITGNSLENPSTGYYSIKEGGGIYTYYSNPNFVNTILWNDTPEEIFIYNNEATFAYSDVHGGQSGIITENAIVNWESGNINMNPFFTDPANADFSLQMSSPAVDAGTAYFEWNGKILVDLIPEDYNSIAPDMGAFESSFSGGGSNQLPAAVASANPVSGDAPLMVQFSSDGSSDPDGTITTYAWDFGDGSTSSDANPSHTFVNAGAYEVVLVVTDNDGATGSTLVTINVAQVSQDELHVQAQSVTREQLSQRNWRGVDTILIADQNNQPIAGVTVTVTYSGPNKGTLSGVTGADGIATLKTNWKRNPNGTWCFEVTDVMKSGYSYNASANIVIFQCE
jgi:PKD repeat protein